MFSSAGASESWVLLLPDERFDATTAALKLPQTGGPAGAAEEGRREGLAARDCIRQNKTRTETGFARIVVTTFCERQAHAERSKNAFKGEMNNEICKDKNKDK
jgi:hypothetical protein